MTPSSQARQAYLGPPATTTRNWGWDHVQPLAPILADLVQVAPAAWAGLAVDVDHDLDPRQMRRQCSAIAAALRARSARPSGAVSSWPASVQAATC